MPLARLFLILFVACSGGAEADPLEISVAGESTPRLNGIAWAALDGFEQRRITHITFHHEGFAGTDADLFRRASAARDRQTIDERVRNIHRYHAGQASLGMFAYHYAVDKAGNIAKGRPVRLKPSTRSTRIGSRKLADFEGHFAVVALGDFNHEKLTDKGRGALVRVMSEAQRRFRVPTARILPHKHHASTSCPGNNLLSETEDLQRRVLAFSLQTELVQRGCLGGAPDGLWGGQSTRALRELARNGGFEAGAPSDTLLWRIMDLGEARCR